MADRRGYGSALLAATGCGGIAEVHALRRREQSRRIWDRSGAAETVCLRQSILLGLQLQREIRPVPVDGQARRRIAKATVSVEADLRLWRPTEVGM